MEPKSPKEEFIQIMLDQLKEMQFENIDKYEEEIRSSNTFNLVKYSDKINELYQSHRRSQIMDQMLAEAEEIGVIAFKEKYGLIENPA